MSDADLLDAAVKQAALGLCKPRHMWRWLLHDMMLQLSGKQFGEHGTRFVAEVRRRYFLLGLSA